MTNNSGRFRPYTIVFYGMKEELMGILKKYTPRIKNYAFILHDKDVYEADEYEEDGVMLKHTKGELKKPHFHVLVDFYDTHTRSQVVKLFKTENDNARVEPVRDRIAQYEYLWHRNDLGKYQYRKSDIVSNDINFYEELCIRGDKPNGDEKAISIVEDMLAGISPRVMMRRYGRDYIIHYTHYFDMAERIRCDEQMRRNRDNNRPKLEPISDDEQLECPFE